MNVEIISRIILSFALVSCVVLLFLDKKSEPTPTTDNDQQQLPINKTINKWSASVPMNSGNTTLEPIIMYSGLNTINYGDNQTFIPIGTYKTDIPIVSNLVVEDIGNGKVRFTTTENGKKYYLTYSEDGDTNPTKDLNKGQLYWTTQQNKEIMLYKNDKKLLFLVDVNGNPTNKQVYFMWYGGDTENRENDSGYFLLKDTDKVGLDSPPNLVTYFFEQQI